MKITKILLSAIVTITLTTTTLAAADVGDDYRSNKWTGHFISQQGPIFNHSPGVVFIIYEGASASHVISKTTFSFSETSGIDDWKPNCELKLEATMSAQQFFDALTKATDIKEIQPPALAKFLDQ